MTLREEGVGGGSGSSVTMMLKEKMQNIIIGFLHAGAVQKGGGPAGSKRFSVDCR